MLRDRVINPSVNMTELHFTERNAVAVKSGLPRPYVVSETARKNSNGHSGFSKAGTISELTSSS
jgi:hypothetical protein